MAHHVRGRARHPCHERLRQLLVVPDGSGIPSQSRDGKRCGSEDLRIGNVHEAVQGQEIGGAPLLARQATSTPTARSAATTHRASASRRVIAVSLPSAGAVECVDNGPACAMAPASTAGPSFAALPESPRPARSAALSGTLLSGCRPSGASRHGARRGPGPGLTIYLPGNGGLLAAVAMMAPGRDVGPDADAPGFPHEGWRVQHESPVRAIGALGGKRLEDLVIAVQPANAHVARLAEP